MCAVRHTAWWQVLDEPAAVAAMQSAAYREEAEGSLATARDVGERCAAAAQRRGVGKTKITVRGAGLRGGGGGGGLPLASGWPACPRLAQ